MQRRPNAAGLLPRLLAGRWLPCVCIEPASASRAVGMANGANPVAIIVPCHRVIGSNGTLTGYGGGLDRKTWLLNHEARWRHEPPSRLF